MLRARLRRKTRGEGAGSLTLVITRTTDEKERSVFVHHITAREVESLIEDLVEWRGVVRGLSKEETAATGDQNA